MSWMSRFATLGQSRRDTKLFSWLESIFQDARFGLRMLRKNGPVTAAAVLSLSLAIGACTAAFSLIDALILRPLPVRDPAKLFYLKYSSPDGTGTIDLLFDHLQQASRNQVDLFGVGFGSHQPAIFDGSGGEEEELEVQLISGDGFRRLGIQPALGRPLTPADDGSAVAVLSYNFWTRRFGSSRTLLGRWFTFRGKPVQIVGVAEKKFSGLLPGYVPDLWLPRPSLSDYRGWEQVWGHLKPDVRPEQARQELQAALTNFLREHPNLSPGGESTHPSANYSNARLDLISAATGHPGTSLRQKWPRPLWFLAFVSGLVLLIACSNVANLLVARAAAREREMAMRISIGASRLRLIRQLLIESSLLAGAACILGLAFASVTAPSIVNLLSASGQRPVYLDVHLDLRILALLASISVSTTLLFGLAPALLASAVSPQEALKAGGAKPSGTIGVLRPLLALQVGFSFVVLFVGGLLLLSFQKLSSMDLGFSKDGVLLVDVRGKVPPGEKARLARLQLLEDIRRLPAVQAASMSDQGLVGGDYAWITTPLIRFPGHEPELIRPRYMAVSPDFFKTMLIPLLHGRDFTERDEAAGSAAVVVNQAFAGRYFPHGNVLGQRLEQVGGGPNAVQMEIVGVVRDAKLNNLREENSPIVYGLLQGINATLEVRTAGDPLALATTIRQAIHGLNPELRVSGVMLQSTRINNTLLSERLLALLSGFFALVAVVLAAVGLYGVLSYSVVRRTKEIGIRVALGARQFGVIRLVVSDITLVVASGLAAGMAGGLAGSRFVSTLLFEVKPSSFWSLAPPSVCLLLAAALAAVLPAFRAARADPMVALREE